MRKQEIKYYILACIEIPTSIILLIGLSIFMTIANDLDKRIVKQEKYIIQLEQEVKQIEMMCADEWYRKINTNNNMWSINSYISN